jgi:hypothetical protein
MGILPALDIPQCPAGVSGERVNKITKAERFRAFPHGETVRDFKRLAVDATVNGEAGLAAEENSWLVMSSV